MFRLARRSKFNILSAALCASLAGFFLLSFDFGLFSSYHVKHDFNEMFQKRMTGNCEAFAQKILIGRDEWKERCIGERERLEDTDVPIVGWEIIDISINGDEAFLQVELERDPREAKLLFAADGREFPEEDWGYRVNYQMKKEAYDWYLNQEINK
jgi:hypothetical protein